MAAPEPAPEPADAIPRNVERDPDCIFCRIVSGGIPADIVGETGGTVTFRDVSPQAPVHLLVVPRRHLENAAKAGREDGDLLAEMLAAANRAAGAEGIGASGYRLVINVGPDALNSVPHLHMHVIGGRQMGWPPG